MFPGPYRWLCRCQAQRLVSHDAVDGTLLSSARSDRMKLLFGALSYLAVVAAVIGAAFAGMSAIEHGSAPDATVGVRAEDETQARRGRAIEDAQTDPNRNPVWIAPTAKYDYTPVSIEPRPKRGPVLSQDARGAMARAGRKARNGRDGQFAIERALRDGTTGAGPALGFAPARRDNDPFHRD
jgi:hypothetical protein